MSKKELIEKKTLLNASTGKIKAKEHTPMLFARSKALYLCLTAMLMKARKNLLINGSSSIANITEQE